MRNFILQCAEDDFSRQPEKVSIGGSEAVSCLSAKYQYGYVDIFIDTKSENVVSVLFSFDSNSNPEDCGKMMKAAAAVLSNISMQKAEEALGKVVSISSLSSGADTKYFSDGVVYEFENGSSTKIAITLTSKSAYSSTQYWSPINANIYFEQLADSNFQNGKYDDAILYYQQAGIVGDKLNEAYYCKAEQALKDDDLDTAGLYFSYAGNYKDSATRQQEVSYKAGLEHLEKNDYESACLSFSMAGSYSDAKDKYKESAYQQGEKLLVDKKYSDAIEWYKSAGDYADAKEKCKETNYAYGEQLLALGDMSGASECFYNASGYLDADIRIDRYYYELGEELFERTEYLDAVEQYSQANNYQDSGTKILECYYLQGKENLSLNYISDAISCFSMCRGYKDTDDLLLGYYYDEAQRSYLSFINAFAENSNYEINTYYEDAAADLALCEGYKDSNNLLNVINTIYSTNNYFRNLSSNKYGVFSLKGMTVSISGNTLRLNLPNWTSDASVVCSMILDYDMSANKFSASLDNMYAGERLTSDKNTKMVESLLLLFTSIEKTNDFVTAYTDVNKWSSSGSGSSASFAMNYGGYSVSINVNCANSRLHWDICAN